MFESFGITAAIVLLIVSLLYGIPVFVGLGLGGLIGSMFFMGPKVMLEMGHLTWESLDKYSLLAIPGFVWMGNLYFQHEFGKELYDAAYKWLGQFRGSLLLASTALGALFGFICGSAAAGAATIGSVTIPEIERRGYDKKLSLGSLAIAGSLSSLIPPSLIMIIYASLAEVSLGRLFFAGIIPGLLLASLIAAYIFVRATVNKDLCPPGPPTSWREKFRSIKGIIPVATSFIIIFGGIYMGVWSAIEAAPVGAIVALLFCAVFRRLTWARFKASVDSTLRICAMVYMIIIAASLLNNFVFVSKLDATLVAAVTRLPLPNWGVMILVLLVLTLMGCVFDVIALVIISISVYLPIVVNVGFDPVWFGIILIVASELALITPPVGVNLYIIKDLAPEGTRTTDVIFGTLPYVIIVWITFALLIIFPGIVLWLPSTIKG
jgi:tripartite ATP-independent transporter DctM subunit